MHKRIFDLVLALLALAILWPVLAVCLYLIWKQDKQNPLYSPYRAGLNNKPFRMHKMRSMVSGADKSQVDTTAANDSRITKLGATLRRFKLDELTQLFNIVLGEMSFVGPRPQIDREVELYTDYEKQLLSVRPGITDFSSIVFSDLGDIMARFEDPNIAYNQLVRPWKSRLGIFYIENQSLGLDVTLIALTALAIISRKYALRGVVEVLKYHEAPDDLIAVASRMNALVPTPPPGSTEIVINR